MIVARCYTKIKNSRKTKTEISGWGDSYSFLHLSGERPLPVLPLHRVYSAFGNSTLSRRSRRSDFGIVLANVQRLRTKIGFRSLTLRVESCVSRRADPYQSPVSHPFASDVASACRYRHTTYWAPAAPLAGLISGRAKYWLPKSGWSLNKIQRRSRLRESSYRIASPAVRRSRSNRGPPAGSGDQCCSDW